MAEQKQNEKFEEFIKKLEECGMKIDDSLKAFLFIIYTIGYKNGNKQT